MAHYRAYRHTVDAPEGVVGDESVELSVVLRWQVLFSLNLEGDVEILQSGIEPGHSLQVAGTVEELVYLILMHDVLEPSRGKADSFLYFLTHFR